MRQGVEGAGCTPTAGGSTRSCRSISLQNMRKKCLEYLEISLLLMVGHELLQEHALAELLLLGRLLLGRLLLLRWQLGIIEYGIHQRLNGILWRCVHIRRGWRQCISHCFSS